MTMGREEHEEHGEHRHGPGCGHESVEHGTIFDYLHDGHRHHEHDGHTDECSDKETADNPAATTGV